MIELFGIPLSALFVALAQVESDRGATSRNVFQIRYVYVDDVNRISGNNLYTYEDVYDVEKAKEMMLVYWRHYGGLYQRRTGKPVTYEVLSRIHNGGPRGYEKHCTLPYWHKVLKVMNGNERRP